MFLRKYILKLLVIMIFCCISASYIYFDVKAEELNVFVTTEKGIEKYKTEPVGLIINGTKMNNLLMPAVNLTGTTYVPVADIFTQLGASVTWNGHLQEVYIGYEGKLIVLRINSKIANINGFLAEMPEPPRIMNDKTMIPVRFIAENAFGFQVHWIEETRTVSVSTVVAEEKPSTGEDAFISGKSDDEEIILIEQAKVPDSEDLAVDISDKNIEYAKYPEAEVISLGIPEASDSQIFEIKASSAISGVNKLLLKDNRLIIDIENAKMGLKQNRYEVNNKDYGAIRTGQFQAEPVKIARVVFDLKTAVNYKVFISEDRKTVYVEFLKNSVLDVEFKTDGIADYVTITTKTSPSVSIMTLTSPDRLVIDVPYSELSAKVLNNAVNGVYSKSIRTGQFDDNTARIVIELTVAASYHIDYKGKTATVKISEPTYKNIRYDPASRSIVIRKDNRGSLVAGAIKLQDMYYDYRYKVELPGDYSNYLGSGDYYVRDEYVNTININTKDGKTEIIINERKIMAVNVTEDNENLYIQLVLPKEKYDKIVVVDPGHGNGDPGTSGNGLVEKDINLSISNKLLSLLETDGRIKVYATRVNDVYPTLAQRAEMGNELGDLFVSIHNNYFDNTAVNGTEVYYYNHSNDLSIGISSEKVAEIIMENLSNDLKSFNRGERIENFEVLRATQIPAVLCEIGYLSNKEEAEKLATNEYRQKVADSIYKSIIKVFENYRPKR